MRGNPPIKHKCLKCGHEEYKKIYDCECGEYCHCERPKCSKCGEVLVPKRYWKSELIGLIEGELCQLYEYDERFNLTDNPINSTVKSIFEYLKVLKMS